MSDTRQPDLFSAGPAAPIDLAAEARRWVDLAARLPAGLRMGTSSWSFPGWRGLVWDREVGAGFLSREGLTAYARHPLLRAAGVDRSYYAPMSAAAFRDHASRVPEDFRFLVKADRRLVFPDGPGSDRDLLLNPVWASDEVVGPAAEGLGARLGCILFQFPPVPRDRVGGARVFADDLHRFLAALRERHPEVPLRVELRTPGLLTPELLVGLADAGAEIGRVVHPEMAPLPEQEARITEGMPAATVPPVGPVVVRWMLQPGHRYAAAKEAFSPFDRLQAPDPARRGEIARTIRSALGAGREVMVIVNNKAEGSAPASITALAEALGASAGPGPDATD